MRESTPSGGPAPGGGMKRAVLTFWRILPNVIMFELLYKLATALVFSPFLSFVIRTAQAAGGEGAAFNEGIRSFFFSPLGILSSLVFVLLGAVVTYYEFSVIVLMAYHCCRGELVGVFAAMKLGFAPMKSLLNTGVIGYALYVLALLPYTNSGIHSSLVTDLSLPHFVTGELSKTTRGSVLLMVGNVLALVLAVLLVFAVPRMVLAKTGFWRAASSSVGMFRKMGGKLLSGVVLGAVLLGTAGYAVHNGVLTMMKYARTVMVNELNPDMLFLPQAGAALAIAVLLWVLGLLFTPLVYTLAVNLYLRLDGVVAPEIDTKIEQMAADVQAAPKKGMRGFARRHPRFWPSVACVAAALVVGLGLIGYTLQDMKDGDKIIFGHRGSGYAVENTLEAIGKAADAGADYAEIDVLLSKDNVPMVIHDASLKRLAGEDLSVGDLTAAELQEITLRQYGMEGKISTLAEVLEFSKGKIDLLIEFKVHGKETDSVVERTMDVVEQAGPEARAQVAFHTLIYSLCAQAAGGYPEYPVGYTVFGSVGNLDVEALEALGVDFIAVEEAMISEELADECHAAGMPVFVWSVNDAAGMREYFDLGADGVITDDPLLGRDVADAYSALAAQRKTGDEQAA